MSNSALCVLADTACASPVFLPKISANRVGIQHLVSVKEVMGPYLWDLWPGRKICIVCNFKCVRTVSLQEHMKNHEPGQNMKNFRCTICNKMFKQNNNRNAHVKNVHLRIKHQCRICGINMGTALGLSVHMTKTHGFAKCNLCNKGFRGDMALHHATNRCLDGQIAIVNAKISVEYSKIADE
jgi:hypothetical protein